MNCRNLKKAIDSCLSVLFASLFLFCATYAADFFPQLTTISWLSQGSALFGTLILLNIINSLYAMHYIRKYIQEQNADSNTQDD